VQKYGTAGEATDDNIILRMRFACWVTKAIDTHSEYVALIKKKGKVIPLQARCGPEGEKRYSSTLP